MFFRSVSSQIRAPTLQGRVRISFSFSFVALVSAQILFLHALSMRTASALRNRFIRPLRCTARCFREYVSLSFGVYHFQSAGLDEIKKAYRKKVCSIYFIFNGLQSDTSA